MPVRARSPGGEVVPLRGVEPRGPSRPARCLASWRRAGGGTTRTLRAAPAAIPAVGLALGVAWGLAARPAPPPVCSALVALALALRGRGAAVVVGLAVGLLRAGLDAPLDPAWPDEDRPVVATGTLDGHWISTGEGWVVPLRAATIRQGTQVRTPAAHLLLEIPGGDPPPETGVLRARGYLKRPAGQSGSALGGGRWRLRAKSRALVEREATGTPWQRAGRRLRQAVERALPATPGLASPGTLVLRALLLGDAAAVPPPWTRGLRATGLAHLLAVSGLHVGLVAGLALVPGAWLPRGPRFTVAVGAVALYALLVGPRSSLLRAAWMAAAALVGLVGARPGCALNGLALAGSGLLLGDPRRIGDLGFLLTCAATLGILVLAPALARRWQPKLGPLARPLAATVAAQIFTLPLTVAAFALATPWAPLLNLVAIPWAAVTLAMGSIGVIGCLVAPEMAPHLRSLFDALAAPFGWPAMLAPALVRPYPWRPAAPAVLAVSALAAAAALRPRLAGPAAAVVLCGLAIALAARAPDPPELVALDVGQGDAFLLRDGAAGILVDGGGWSRGEVAAQRLLPALADLGVRRLAAVLMTHPDRDHCRGLIEIAAYVPVAEVWLAPGWGGDPCVTALMTLPGTALRILWSGNERNWRRWRLRVLAPEPGQRLAENDRSLVIAASARGCRFLLTGDIERAAEERLVRSTPPGSLACDVLKVAHHGSRTSTSSGLLDAARPRWALVSVGAGNPYGHPAPEVLGRLAARGVRILRTDRLGGIRIAPLATGRLRVATERPAAATDSLLEEARDDARLLGGRATTPRGKGVVDARPTAPLGKRASRVALDQPLALEGTQGRIDAALVENEAPTGALLDPLDEFQAIAVAGCQGLEKHALGAERRRQRAAGSAKGRPRRPRRPHWPIPPTRRHPLPLTRIQRKSCRCGRISDSERRQNAFARLGGCRTRRPSCSP